MEVLPVEENIIDAHGEVDLFAEEGIWQNLKLRQQGRRHVIDGVSLNALLLGHFTLYGTQKDALHSLPGGGINSWEETLEAFFICMRQIATTDCIMRRIRAIAKRFHYCTATTQKQRNDEIEGSMLLPDVSDLELREVSFTAVTNVLYGALTYCIYWIYCFRSFLTDADLARLRVTINGLEEFILPPGASTLTTTMHPGTASFEAYSRVHARYMELLSTAGESLELSVIRSLGVDIDQRKSHLFTCGGDDTQQLLKFAASAAAAPASPAHLPASGSLHNPMLEVDVPLSVGNWTGHEITKQREQLKATLTQGPPLKLEIFGGDALLDEIDDDDDEEEEDNAEKQHFSTGADDVEEPCVAAPISRIPLGSSLLLNPLAVGNSLLDIDALELARQWTIVDHVYFCSIPLHSLVPMVTTIGDGSAIKKQKPVSELARYQQLRRGAQACGARGGARGFIDRFNALSNWVTFTILSADTPEKRASRIGCFIRIGGHLMELSNFNGLMVVLTALQQGSINRLRRTWEAVGKSEKLKLAQMQKLMAAGKNYQFYRQELEKLSIHFELTDGNSNDRKKRMNHPSIYHRSEMMWKTHIHLRQSMNNDDAMNKTTPRRRSTFTNEDKFEALVPHLGAHLAELTSIEEGNSDFLADRSYLYNVQKFILMSNTLSLLQKLQRLKYNLTPVRLIIAALNNIAKQHLRQSSADASSYSKELYAMSEAAESAADLQQQSPQSVRQQPPRARNDADAERDEVQDSLQHGTDSSRRVRSAAYERIVQRKSMSERTDAKNTSEVLSKKASPVTSSTMAARRRMTVLDTNNRTEAKANAETEEENDKNQSDDDEEDDDSSNSSSSSGSSETESTEQERKKKGLFARSAKLVRKLTWGLSMRSRSKKVDD